MYKMLPTPVFMEFRKDEFILGYDAYIVLPAESPEYIYQQACILRDAIQKTLSYQLHLTKGEARPGDIRIVYDEKIHENPEYYELQVNERGVQIAGTKQSIIHGIATFIMLLEQSGARLPFLALQDYPVMSQRGFLYDVTRGRVPRLATLKWLADQMMRYKLNQLQLYVEHTYLFRDFSEVWRDDTPLTPEEILELDTYCFRRGIELVPAIATCSHLYEVLRTKQYRHLCELNEPDRQKFTAWERQVHHTVDISNEDSLRLVKKMLNEYRPLFRSNKFNICGDETFDMGKGKSRAFCEREGSGKAYVGYIRQICEHVISLGCTPMMWGDVISEHPGLLPEMPAETVFLNWAYHAEVTDELTKRFGESGVKYLNCPGANGWCRLVDDYDTAYENIRRMTVYARENQGIGLLNTQWGDYYHTSHPGFSLVGLIYGAQSSWGDPMEKTELDMVISALEFGENQQQMVGLFSRIERNSLYSFMGICTFCEYMPERNGPAEFLQKTFGSRELPRRLAAANAELEQVKVEISAGLVQVPHEKKELLKAYIIAVDGSRYFNRLGAVITKREYHNEDILKAEADKLAADLENWFYYFAKLWRSVSKESELARIQHVINWYCDYLRETD